MEKHFNLAQQSLAGVVVSTRKPESTSRSGRRESICKRRQENVQSRVARESLAIVATAQPRGISRMQSPLSKQRWEDVASGGEGEFACLKENCIRILVDCEAEQLVQAGYKLRVWDFGRK